MNQAPCPEASILPLEFQRMLTQENNKQTKKDTLVAYVGIMMVNATQSHETLLENARRSLNQSSHLSELAR